MKGREETQVKGPGNIFNRIIEENFSNLKKRPNKVQEAYRMPNRLDQKRKLPGHIIIKTVNAQNKESTLKGTREKDQVTYKGKPIKKRRLLHGVSKSKKGLDRCYTSLKNPQMPDQATRSSKSFNHNKWRKKLCSTIKSNLCIIYL